MKALIAFLQFEEQGVSIFIGNDFIVNNLILVIYDNNVTMKIGESLISPYLQLGTLSFAWRSTIVDCLLLGSFWYITWSVLVPFYKLYAKVFQIYLLFDFFPKKHIFLIF
jgi:hypothetical protein